MSTKIKILIIVGAIVALAAIFIPLTFFVFLKKSNLPAPNAPTLILTDTKIFASTNEIDGATSYIFKFTTPNNTIIKITSASPSIYIDTNTESSEYVGDFSLAGIYEVKCSAVGEDLNLASDYSQGAPFEKYVKLTKPTTNLYTSSNRLIFRWATIDHANLYEIYITSSTEPTQKVQYISINNLEFEIFELENYMINSALAYGEYQVSIVAKNSTNNYYLESLSSAPITFNYEAR